MSNQNLMDPSLLSRIASDFTDARNTVYQEKNADNKNQMHGNSKLIKALQEFPGISDVYLINREEDNIGLTAYLAVINFTEQPFIIHPKISAEKISAFLHDKKLECRLPRAYVYLDRLPLDPSLLPIPTALNADFVENTEAAFTETEKQLVLIWEELLGKKDIPINADFFRLGGHSLLAVQLLSRVYKEFGVEVPIKGIFAGKSLTIYFLAAEIEKLQIEAADPGELATIIQELDSLSEEQIKALLAEEDNG